MIALADAFCMVPAVGRPLHWWSGHYELRVDEGTRTVDLRNRSGRPQAFVLTLYIWSGEPVRAAVRGQLSPQGYRDLVAADELLDGVILDALCDAVGGGPPACLGDLLAAQQEGRRHG